MIKLEHLNKRFGNDIHAVNDISLQVDEGDIYGIIGYSGAGKSTLIRLINQLEVQDSGKVWIDHVDLSTLSAKELRRERQKIGMIFQHFNLLWSKTVIENIELPLELAGYPKEKRRARSLELCKLVGLQGRENHHTHQLSGGQKQRVGIARALAAYPKILLCDEATSALDPETTEAILDLLLTINQKLHVTIVLITHQIEVIQKICNKVAILSEGKLLEEGSVKAVFGSPKHEITKRFVATIDAGENIPLLQKELKTLYPQGEILRLTFSESNSKEPIIAACIRKFPWDISLLDSHITHTRFGLLGFTYLHVIPDERADVQDLISYLRTHAVQVEVIK